ncbi:MAG TPA: altronate dehydrogenase [Gemmataceae bacterium]|nr:altronate dehydrogenase [Gemmataceae bacterium]
MAALPETVLQFGTGKFLRGFADLFIHQANQEGQAVGRVVAVQATGAERARLINAQGGRYHVLVRGLHEGQVVDRVEESASLSRALVAAEQWPEILAVARSPDLRILLCNTAEAGYTLDPSDTPDRAPPHSFPAKLLLLLRARYEAGLPGLTVLPCELFERNADLLRGILHKLADAWDAPPAFRAWLDTACTWHNTLVDRIVAVPSAADPRPAGDALAVVAEPFAFWAVEVKNDQAAPFRHPALRTTPDVNPFFLRKVRILNAAHTAMIARARPKGVRTVLEAMRDPEIAGWLERLLFEEILPVLEGRVEDGEGFARQTLERFRNPFLEHKMSDIAVYHEQKVRIRLVPTRDEYAAKFGRQPPLLNEAIGGAA